MSLIIALVLFVTQTVAEFNYDSNSQYNYESRSRGNLMLQNNIQYSPQRPAIYPGHYSNYYKKPNGFHTDQTLYTIPYINYLQIPPPVPYWGFLHSYYYIPSYNLGSLQYRPMPPPNRNFYDPYKSVLYHTPPTQTNDVMHTSVLPYQSMMNGPQARPNIMPTQTNIWSRMMSEENPTSLTQNLGETIPSELNDASDANNFYSDTINNPILSTDMLSTRLGKGDLDYTTDIISTESSTEPEPPKVEPEPPKVEPEPPKVEPELPKVKPEPPKVEPEPPKVEAEPPKDEAEEINIEKIEPSDLNLQFAVNINATNIILTTTTAPPETSEFDELKPRSLMDEVPSDDNIETYSTDQIEMVNITPTEFSTMKPTESIPIIEPRLSLIDLDETSDVIESTSTEPTNVAEIEPVVDKFVESTRDEPQKPKVEHTEPTTETKTNVESTTTNSPITEETKIEITTADTEDSELAGRMAIGDFDDNEPNTTIAPQPVEKITVPTTCPTPYKDIEEKKKIKKKKKCNRSDDLGKEIEQWLHANLDRVLASIIQSKKYTENGTTIDDIKPRIFEEESVEENTPRNQVTTETYEIKKSSTEINDVEINISNNEQEQDNENEKSTSKETKTTTDISDTKPQVSTDESVKQSTPDTKNTENNKNSGEKIRVRRFGSN